MTIPINRLPLKSVVQLPGTDIVAQLVKINSCRAYVRVDGPDKLVTIGERSFVAQGGRFDNWAPSTIVSVLSARSTPAVVNQCQRQNQLF